MSIGKDITPNKPKKQTPNKPKKQPLALNVKLGFDKPTKQLISAVQASGRKCSSVQMCKWQVYSIVVLVLFPLKGGTVQVSLCTSV